MGKGKKFFGKKGGLKPTTKKKRKLLKEKEATINKKALFNRYKNKQKLEEVLIKKKQMDKRFQQQVMYSESEEEEDAYGQLVSCFSKAKKGKVAESDESMSDDDSVLSEPLESDSEVDNEQEGNYNAPLAEDDGDEKEAISEGSDEDEMQEIGVYCLFLLHLDVNYNML